MASARVQRWASLLATYKYRIQHRPGTQMANADALSRLPLPETVDNVPEPAEHITLINHLAKTPLTAKHVKEWTDTDPVLSRFRQFILCEWTEVSDDSRLLPYQHR